jgi:hypothetical protein
VPAFGAPRPRSGLAAGQAQQNLTVGARNTNGHLSPRKIVTEKGKTILKQRLEEVKEFADPRAPRGTTIRFFDHPGEVKMVETK